MKFFAYKKIIYGALCMSALFGQRTTLSDKKMVIIDTDPGGDDALAILLAAYDERLKVCAITTTYGNASLQETTDNAAYIMHRFGIRHIPLYSGSSKPLVRKHYKDYFWGPTGLDAIRDLKKHSLSYTAVQRMIRLIKKHPNKITILALGPLTNIAQAIKKDPHTMSKVREIIALGGNLGTMHELQGPEFNIESDPEAADFVFKSGIPIKIITFDTATRLAITWGELLKSSPLSVQDFILQMFGAHKQKRLTEYVYDPLVVYAASYDTASIPVSITISHESKNGGQTQGQPCLSNCTVSYIDNLNKGAIISYFSKTLNLIVSSRT